MLVVWAMTIDSETGFSLIEVMVASAVAAVALAGVITAAAAVTLQQRQAERTWTAAEVTAQVLDQWRGADVALLRQLDGWRLALDAQGRPVATGVDDSADLTVVVQGTTPAGWPPGTVRVDACAYRGRPETGLAPIVCLQTGFGGGW